MRRLTTTMTASSTTPPHHLLLSILLLLPQSTTPLPKLPKLPRLPRLSQRLNPPTNLPSYSRMLSTPAFAVTTPWGSPYMIFERLSRKENADEDLIESIFSQKTSPDDSLPPEIRPDGGDENDAEPERTRTTALYFTDPDDALSLRDEMKQMGGGMATADVRVMSTTLGRAVRQASVLGGGLPTGQPLDEATGRLTGGLLRYKLVPSRRELFYAARCVGKERVGMFGESGGEDAREVMMDAATRQREGQRRALMERAKRGAGRRGEESGLRVEYASRRGTTGVPLFYVEGLKGRGVNGREEIPLFFSYEDLMRQWRVMKGRKGVSEDVPVRPPTVEVFNFVDVVTALDKEQWRKQQQQDQGGATMTSVLNNVRQKVTTWKTGAEAASTTTAIAPVVDVNPDGLELEKVVFVPSSRALAFKEQTTAKGNGKARLRPMR